MYYKMSVVDIEKPTWSNRFVSDDAAFQMYLRFFEGGKTELKEKYENDSVMWSEDWSIYTDALCKDDKISDKQYHDMAALNEFLGIAE